MDGKAREQQGRSEGARLLHHRAPALESARLDHGDRLSHEAYLRQPGDGSENADARIEAIGGHHRTHLREMLRPARVGRGPCEDAGGGVGGQAAHRLEHQSVVLMPPPLIADDEVAFRNVVFGTRRHRSLLGCIEHGGEGKPFVRHEPVPEQALRVADGHSATESEQGARVARRP